MDEITGSSNIIELLKIGARYLEDREVADPRAEVDILLAHILGISRAGLYLQTERQVSEQEKSKFIELLTRRGDREPLAYLLKTREFMGLEFYVDQRVLVPRPETELLVEKILEIGKNKVSKGCLRLLDLCTGSGSIAVSAAYFCPKADIVAVDISQDALAVAKQNADRMQVEIDFRQGDLFGPVKGETFDIIVSNPPYISSAEYHLCPPEVKKEPVLALWGGDDGLDFYQRIAAQGESYLNPDGVIALEIGCSQGSEITRLFKARGFKAEIFPDYAGLDRIVLAEKE